MIIFTNNIAAIELPFNKDICNVNVKIYLKKAKIGSSSKIINELGKSML